MPRTKGFEELMKATRRQYLGKEVPKQYRKKYGKRYSKKETEAIAYAIAKKLNIKIEK